MPFFFSTDSLSLVQLIMIQKGRLLEDEARFYTAEVADALEYKHSVGLIRRDIKVFSQQVRTFLFTSKNC